MRTLSDLATRQKGYEDHWCDRSLLPRLPICARMDGRAFHSFTRRAARPFDAGLHEAMVLTTRDLVEETTADVGYTQSDEISLVWRPEEGESERFFGGRVLKMTGILASMTTLYFARHAATRTQWATGPAMFDARVWNVPDIGEAVNYLLWRERDATRNSIQMAAQAKFSHKRLHGMNTAQMQEALFQEHGINWNDYSACFKRGTYVGRVATERPFTTDEIEKLPAKHNARTNPDLVVLRRDTRTLEMPKLEWSTARQTPVGSVLFAMEDRTHG